MIKKRNFLAVWMLNIKVFWHRFLLKRSARKKSAEVSFMAQNVMDLQDVSVRDCMVPREKIVAVDVDSSLDELQRKFTETGFSKVLIYEKTLDCVLGYVHAFDLFKNPKNIRDILRKVEVVSETMPSNDLLKEMIEQKRSITVVANDSCITLGLITLEDLMEEIFGEIDDEFDK